jgi:hypothetical protein
MEARMVDVMIHIDPDTKHSEREDLRDVILEQRGVDAAAYHDSKPHLMVVEYNPDVVTSQQLLEVVVRHGFQAELIGL